MGIVVDDQGHVMVPHYVDGAAFTEPVPVSLADGRLALATFVGSDRQTDLTVLKMSGIKTKALSMSTAEPGAGALVLVVSLNPAFNRLAVWAGGEPDLGVVASPDGGIAGFTYGGRFRPAAPSQPIAQELIEHGQVRRPFLGVSIETVAPDDPERSPNESLRDAPALRIQKVIPGSIADRAGLRAGDLILKLANESVTDAPAFAAAIARSRGETEMVILRDGEQISVKVDLQVQ
jgi:S1-C subfamily serine protease